MEWVLGAQSGLKYGSMLVIKAEAEERDKMHDQLAFSWGLVHSVKVTHFTSKSFSGSSLSYIYFFLLKISALEEYAAMTLDKMRDIPQVLGK